MQGAARREPTLDDIRKMSYTRLALAEGLRLYPQVCAGVCWRILTNGMLSMLTYADVC